MKKLLLASVAVTGLAFAAPAHAEVDLELGGYFKGYGAFVSQDETTGTDVNSFDFVRETEVHMGGETTLDNGLTVGAHMEFTTDGVEANPGIDESYVYFSGNWGRVNFGEENGAGYLLQVAAPSADSNVDGLVQFVSGFVSTGNLSGSTNLDYDIGTDTAKFDKLTYLSPILNGFQLGASYTPDVTGDSAQYGVSTTTSPGTAGAYDDAYEVAIRYEGEFEEVGIIAGAGYTLTREDGNSTTTDDQEMWNVGLDLDIAAFGLGAIFMNDNNGVKGTSDLESDTYVIGADYTTGPFKIGVSYLNLEQDGFGATNDREWDRYTGGVVYEYGPGMTFRGSVQVLEQDNPTGTADADGTAVLLGTQINF